MTNKRKHPAGTSSIASDSKRSRIIDQRGNDEAPGAPQSKIDPTYGQRGAFPGLDDTPAADELFYGPADDGLEYLRMVRLEAKGVPNLLTAPSKSGSRQEDLYADYPQGYYSDGAYTAAPLQSSAATPQIQDRDDPDPQDAYYVSLMARFADLQTTLHSASDSININHTATLLLQNKRAIWRGKLLKTTPTMQTLGHLSQESIIYGLEVLGQLLTQSNLKIGKYGKNLGAWAWGLLGACRAVGQMSSEEVGVLREMGKQAIWLLRRMAAGEVDEGAEAEDEAMHEQDGQDAPTGEEDYATDMVQAGGQREDDDPVVAAQQRLLSSLGVEEPKQMPSAAVDGEQEDSIIQRREADQLKNETHDLLTKQTVSESISQSDILATLDVIATIVGEAYGQRDLLDSRLLWDEI